MIWYHGDKRTKSYFEGWYLKCPTKDGQCLALIPAIHIDGDGCKTASIQVITENQSWWLHFPGDLFHAEREHFLVQIDGNVFSKHGVELAIHEDGIDLVGKIRFGPFQPLRYSIMGPFEFLPKMECAHGVISMKHRLEGELLINDERIEFIKKTFVDFGATEDIMYLSKPHIESDRGSSFPSSYLWAQDTWAEGSFMLSIAEIPFGRLSFTGCICAINLDGKEYRIATYLGARVGKWSSTFGSVRQGRYSLEVEVLKKRELPLKAPCTGKMIRTIHESLRAAIRVRFLNGETILLDRTTDMAGVEFSQNP